MVVIITISVIYNKLIKPLMRQQLIIILTFFILKSYGQCGREYPSGFYHNSKFVNTHGDTLNKLDNLGLYDGLHLYTKSEHKLYNDTISYLIGKFNHGQPIGEWKDHCNDGSYSIGQFKMGSGESSSDGKGGWVEKKQGLYVKVGIWNYFNNKGILEKTMRYDREFNHKGWTDQTFEMDTTGEFILTEYKFNSRHNLDSRFKKRVNKSYSKKGIPISSEYEGFWKDISYEYNEKGQVSKIIKRRKLFGKRLNTIIEKEYNNKGQLKCKKKCKHPDHNINVHWL